VSGVVWHDTECGAYEADLGLWEELAEEATGPVLDLGCGTGRVALHLARRGHPVTGLDLDPDLVEAFGQRAAGLPGHCVLGDARDFELGTAFGLAIAPMQLLQLLSGAAERIECLSCVERHLEPGGIAAIAIVEAMPDQTEASPPLPDAREVEGWVYSSLPLGAAFDEEEIVVRRLRQTVSPSGELDEELDEVRLSLLSAATVESEGLEAGLAPAGRRQILPTDDHVGSTVVLLAKES
jgi:SAM-dependent methyltransferase